MGLTAYTDGDAESDEAPSRRIARSALKETRKGVYTAPHRCGDRVWAMIPCVLKRFLLLAIPTLILVMGLFHFGLERLQLDPEGVAASPHHAPAAWLVAATWLLEALGLSAAYLLLGGRSGEGRWWNGLMAAWIAWVFRGPLLVVSVVNLAALPARPWWHLALSWWVLYTLCGLTLAALAGPRPDFG